MTHFRPCIDLHNGQVKQIVGGSLSDNEGELKTNFEATENAAWYANMYRKDQLKGGHVIKLGPGNDFAARSALAAYPKGLQIGGGINIDNAQEWLDAGASHVIITSILFDKTGRFQQAILDEFVERIGKKQLVIDLSCRRTHTGWTVAMNRWQTLTNLELNSKTLDQLASQCDEFLIHAADVEGLCQGIDHDLVTMLGQWRGCPCTYAGGINSIDDFELIDRLSSGQVDATVGSALDIFGGSSVNYADLVAKRG